MVDAELRQEEEDEPLVIDADPLESEPESDDDDNGVYSPEFIASTGVRVYEAACERLKITPVQQFIAMMDQSSVSLKHRGLGAAGGVALFECLRINTCIQALDVEDNQLGLGIDPDAGGLEHISSALSDNKLLSLLDLSYNNLSSRGCAAISEALSRSCLAELSLRGNAMGDLGALAFAQALGSNRTVTKLDVSDNNIDEAGAVALASLLTRCEQLRYADFSWNSIRLNGAQALTDALKASKVARLNLAWNGLGDRGAKTLAGALAENAELQFLDISKNNLNEEAAVALARALALNSTLRSLQLNGNQLSAKGVGLIVQAVGVKCTLRDLGLRGVALEHSGVGLFDPLNPTGRFTVDLADPFERSIVHSHLELDRQDEASGIDNFLNVKLNGKEVVFGDGGDIQSWRLPAAGTLTYDYVSGKRVPRDARAQRDAVFASFCSEMESSHSADAERLVALRLACITHFFTCAQARQLLVLFTYTQRADAAIILFRRCVDPQHFGAIWQLLSAAERNDMHERLGEALEPYLPEDERVKVFLTQMDANTSGAPAPLKAELDAVWQQILPALNAALGAALGAEQRPSVAMADAALIAAHASELRAVLDAEFESLRAVYRFYAAGDEREASRAMDALDDVSALRLSVRELWHLCTACKLCSSSLPLSVVDALFFEPDGEQQTAIDQGELEIELAGFLIGLVRLALAHRALLVRGAAAHGGAAGVPPPREQLVELLHGSVLKYGQREEADSFRKEFWMAQVQNALIPLWYPLKAVFDRWKAIDHSEGANSRTMSVVEFCSMLKTKELLDYSELPESLKMHEAIDAFHLARAAGDYESEAGVHDSQASADGAEGSSGAELIFIEFVEAIGRCAVKSIDEDLGEHYAQMPLAERLVIFINKLIA